MRRRVALLASLAVLVGMLGCADAASPALEVGEASDEPTRRYQFDPELAPEVSNGLAVREVVARGAGCPAGSWFTEISDDGKSFRVRLIGYEAEIDDQRAYDRKTCTLSIALRSAVPVSFAVRSVAYLGFSFLDDGVRARFDTRSYFPDDPFRSAHADALQLVGPYDDEFTQQAQAKVLKWSACGVGRNVEVRTTLALLNTTPRGVGFISIGEAHGAVPGAVDTARFGITFAVRTCGDSVDAGTLTPTTPTDAGAPARTTTYQTIVRTMDSGVPLTELVSLDTK